MLVYKGTIQVLFKSLLLKFSLNVINRRSKISKKTWILIILLMLNGIQFILIDKLSRQYRALTGALVGSNLTKYNNVIIPLKNIIFSICLINIIVLLIIIFIKIYKKVRKKIK